MEIFTDTESVSKKYTVQQAVDAAAFICKDKYNVKLNVSKLGRDRGEKVTLKELNNISDKLISDSI